MDLCAPARIWGGGSKQPSSHTPHQHHLAHLAPPAQLGWTGEKNHSMSWLSLGPHGALAPTSPLGQPAETTTTSSCPWTPPLSYPLV